MSALLKGDPGSPVTLFVSSHADSPREAPVYADTLVRDVYGRDVYLRGPEAAPSGPEPRPPVPYVVGNI